MSSSRRILLLVLGAALLVALLVGLSLPRIRAVADSESTVDANKIFWDVVASGGSTITSAHYIMHSTAGQPVIGTMASTHYILHSGYWYTSKPFLFLPIIEK
jgi:hypothetical protein